MSEYITPVMYLDSDGNMAELIAGLTLGQVALAVVAVVVATVAVLAIADVIGIPGAGDVLDGVKDTINQIGQSIQNSLDKMKQNIKIFAIAAAVAIGTKTTVGLTLFNLNRVMSTLEREDILEHVRQRYISL